jgi:hypothetical protein
MTAIEGRPVICWELKTINFFAPQRDSFDAEADSCVHAAVGGIKTLYSLAVRFICQISLGVCFVEENAYDLFTFQLRVFLFFG